MSFKESYRQAVEKVSADEEWKQQTLQKMHCVPSSSFSVWKKAALPMAAGFLILCSGVLFFSPSNALSTGQASSSDSNNTFAQDSMPQVAGQGTREVPSLLADDSAQAKVFDAPQPAMLSNQQDSLPVIDFSSDSVQEISSDRLPILVDTESAQALPVWEETDQGLLLMGEYPILSEQTVSTQVLNEQTEGDFAVTELVYVQSAGYVQPVYRFVPISDDLPNLYVSAIGGEYYNKP